VRADAIVVPRHGAKTSSTAEFVTAVSPRVAVISVGRNTFGYPAPEVVARYDAISIYRTDEDGDVTLRSDGTRLWVATGHRGTSGAQTKARATVTATDSANTR
jgi:competence protein ComEC